MFRISYPTVKLRRYPYFIRLQDSLIINRKPVVIVFFFFLHPSYSECSLISYYNIIYNNICPDFKPEILTSRAYSIQPPICYLKFIGFYGYFAAVLVVYLPEFPCFWCFYPFFRVGSVSDFPLDFCICTIQIFYISRNLMIFSGKYISPVIIFPEIFKPYGIISRIKPVFPAIQFIVIFVSGNDHNTGIFCCHSFKNRNSTIWCYIFPLFFVIFIFILNIIPSRCFSILINMFDSHFQ